MNANGDPDDTGYASMAVAPVTIPPLEAVLSLARFLDTDVATAGGMLMGEKAAEPIQVRNRQLDEERRQRQLDEERRGRTLDGAEAAAITRRRYVVPL